MKYAYIKINDTIVICNPVPTTIQSEHPHYEYILTALEEERDEDLTLYLQPIKAIFNHIKGHPEFTIKNDTLYHKDQPTPPYIATKILDLYKAGKPIDRMLKFLTHLEQNPSYRVRDQLYQFLEIGQLPITENGTFLAYKKINTDWTDCHTGKIYNYLNTPVRMDRRNVDDDPNHPCSTGLHVCSFDYLREFHGDRLITVEVNPQDVVSIPSDYNHTKMRVCEYIPRAEINIDIAENIWAQTPFPDNKENNENEENEELLDTQYD